MGSEQVSLSLRAYYLKSESFDCSTHKQIIATIVAVITIIAFNDKRYTAIIVYTAVSVIARASSL